MHHESLVENTWCPILGFHVTSEKTKIKLKLKILIFLPLSGKSNFSTNIYWPVFSSVDRLVLKIEQRFFTMRDIGIVPG